LRKEGRKVKEGGRKVEKGRKLKEGGREEGRLRKGGS
jgi:hypothetical protein